MKTKLQVENKISNLKWMISKYQENRSVWESRGDSHMVLVQSVKIDALQSSLNTLKWVLEDE